jgi:hypothetical protein
MTRTEFSVSMNGKRYAIVSAVLRCTYNIESVRRPNAISRLFSGSESLFFIKDNANMNGVEFV